MEKPEMTKTPRCPDIDDDGWCRRYQLWCKAYSGCGLQDIKPRGRQTALSMYPPIPREGAPLGEPGTSRRGYTRNRVERDAGGDACCSAEAEPGEAGASPTWQL